MEGIRRDTFCISKRSILRDYKIAYRSRQASIVGRKEVFTGKAKFGIFGDGKEVAQVAMAEVFRQGDFRSGYYRDQTFMFALGMTSIDEFFAQLYAHADLEAEPASGGRSMTAHFATRSLNPDGSWRSLVDMFNSSADVSPTGSQMPRLIGLAQASKLYRELRILDNFSQFSRKGDEIAFGTIGNASCAEGLFWESINAIGVLQVPVLLSIWDDHYGISVPNEYQITKSDVSQVLQGFQRDGADQLGFEMHRVKGWDYPALCETYINAAETVRREHVPAIIHVSELTQPQGHSTSGSHERYKDRERLAWEEEFDCIKMMRKWIIEQEIASVEELDLIDREELQVVLDAKSRAWSAFIAPLEEEREGLLKLLGELANGSAHAAEIGRIGEGLRRQRIPGRKDLMRAIYDALAWVREEDSAPRQKLIKASQDLEVVNAERYGSDLYSASEEAALKVPAVSEEYDDDAPMLRGYEILNRYFDHALTRYPNLIAFGEDVGKLGDVNQGFHGLQEKYGETRVADGGIREATLIGQAIGLAMRGLRPLVEIQYLDYLLYALQLISDDLATLRWRTRGGQKAPVIIRTRGHRLEGIWHAGSPMAGIINLIQGVYVCVPRDMTRAAGFYNTMLQSDDAALIVEVLNGYRLREKLPENLGKFSLPLGQPELLRSGSDVTVVTYGACCRIAADAAEMLARLGVEIEVIDVQTLLPFDLHGRILESLMKTGRIVFLDEDVPGGASAYMLQQVLDGQGGYEWLDSAPLTISSTAHRPAYGSDGDYWSKPNRERVVREIYALMREANPRRYPPFV